MTQTLCAMSNFLFFATHTDLHASNPSHSNKIPHLHDHPHQTPSPHASNPSHSNKIPHLHDHPHQTPSPPLTANSFIGTPPPEDKPDQIFWLLLIIAKKVYRFQADKSCLYEHNLVSTITLSKTSFTTPHNTLLATPNILQPSVLSQLHLPLSQVEL